MERKRRILFLACGAALSAALAVPPGASAETLAYLIGDAARYVYSSDGSVRFDSFQYVPTVGAPNAADVTILPHASVLQGFLLEGTFSVINGNSLNALLGYNATVVSSDASFVFSEAKLNLVESLATGSWSPSFGSSAFVAEKVDSLALGNLSVATLTVAQSAVQEPVLTDLEPLMNFGKALGVLTNIGLTAMPGAMSEATVKKFSVNFEVVPEPASGLLLLGLCGVAALRRR